MFIFQTKLSTIASKQNQKMFSLQLSLQFKERNIFEIRFPKPQPTDLGLIKDIFFDAFSIAIISLAINVSLAKLYAERYEYEIDVNQVTFFMIKTSYFVF